MTFFVAQVIGGCRSVPTVTPCPYGRTPPPRRRKATGHDRHDHPHPRADRPARVAAAASGLPAVHRAGPDRRAGTAAADGQRAEPGRADQARGGDRGGLDALRRGRGRGDEPQLGPRRLERGTGTCRRARRWPGCWPTTRRSPGRPTSWSPPCPTSTPTTRCPRRRGSSRAPAGRPAGCSCTSSPRPSQHAGHADILRESIDGQKTMGEVRGRLTRPHGGDHLLQRGEGVPADERVAERQRGRHARRPAGR